MPRKVATHRHITRSRAYSFTFLPNEYLTKADWERLREDLIAQRGSPIFFGMKAWRLRLDSRSSDKLKTPWALALPLGSFSTFEDGLCTPEGDLAGRQACIDQIRANRTNPTTKKLPGPVGLGFSLTRDIFVREGVTYYREMAIEAFRNVAPNPRLWWAFFHLIREVHDKPQIITQLTYRKDGTVKRVRPFVPLAERKKLGNRPVRGLAWSPKEDALIRLFFDQKKCLSVHHFEAQERAFALEGEPPRDRVATIKRWEAHILGDLSHKRSLSSIKQRIHYLNRQTRLKYMVNGRVPKAVQKEYEAALLGISGRGAYVKKISQAGWLLIGQAGSNGPVFIAHTKAVLLRAATVGKALPTSFKIIAFVKQPPAAVSKLRTSLQDFHQLHNWYTPSIEVNNAITDAQMQTVSQIKAGHAAYCREAKRLGSWLSWDLLKHLPDDPSS